MNLSGQRKNIRLLGYLERNKRELMWENKNWDLGDSLGNTL